MRTSLKFLVFGLWDCYMMVGSIIIDACGRQHIRGMLTREQIRVCTNCVNLGGLLF